ncbi:LysR family transcriptional regulator [Gulosibacter molinativorax]|uniref:LysR family transcriptional regulator n=1 Tax=Gulosibacter molinativorax TaxID=256821 RepID=A0ABT7C7S8_9MICO|nr:LysR substrate-binding domain-containing protein [Gulosibacter molinativorax]MDJ1371212.1 LysR family transcriptional regulator [Gulosibacter molinativorax]QUY63027.1 Hca operon transcriptional activator [Gulosibacter molinativorax]
MELRQLRYFLAVAEELHFGRAAERLRVSQPPLSVAVKSLEDELGVSLFNRSTRRVTLTPEGELLQRRVTPILEDLDQVASEVADVRKGLRGLLRIGYVSSASYTILPRAVQLFQGRLPLIDLQLNPLTSGEQLERMRDGGIDLGIVRDQSAVPGLRLEPVLEERLVVVLPVEHPLSRFETVKVEQLEGEPLVLFAHELMPGYVTRITEVLEANGAMPRVVQRIVHQETVLGLVAAGVGLSVLPESVARISMPGVAVRPLAGDPISRLQLAAPGTLAPAARAFAECVRDASAAV